MKKLLTILLLSVFAAGCASTDKMNGSSDGMMMNDKNTESMDGSSIKHDDMKMKDGMMDSMDKDPMM